VHILVRPPRRPKGRRVRGQGAGSRRRLRGRRVGHGHGWPVCHLPAPPTITRSTPSTRSSGGWSRSSVVRRRSSVVQSSVQDLAEKAEQCLRRNARRDHQAADPGWWRRHRRRRRSGAGQHGVNIMNSAGLQRSDESQRGNVVRSRSRCTRTIVHVHHQDPAGPRGCAQGAGVEKGSGEPHKTKVARVTRAQVRDIAQSKLDDSRQRPRRREKIIAHRRRWNHGRG